jgi:hypothetical protein
MKNTFKVELPHSPFKLIALYEEAIKHLETLAKSDPILGLIDLDAMKQILIGSVEQNDTAGELRSKSEQAVRERNNILGISMGQNISTPGTGRNLAAQLRDVLIAKYRNNPKTLERFGFHVTYTSATDGSHTISGNTVDPNTKTDSESYEETEEETDEG